MHLPSLNLGHRASPFKAQRAIFTLTFAFKFKRLVELFTDGDTSFRIGSEEGESELNRGSKAKGIPRAHVYYSKF